MGTCTLTIRSHHHFPVDSGLRRRTGEADPAASADEQRLVARGRNLCEDRGPLDLSVSSGRWPGPDYRLPALGQAGCGSGQALLPQGVGPASYREPAHHHRGQESRLPKGRDGNEGGRRAVVALAVAPSEVSEQHFGAGSPTDQTPDRPRAGFWRLLDGATNTGGLRGNGDDQKGAGSEDRRQRHEGTSRLHRPAIPRSRQNPKILGRDDAEVVRDLIAVEAPVPWYLFAQEREDRLAEVFEGLVACVVGDVFVHQPPQPFDRIQMCALGRG